MTTRRLTFRAPGPGAWRLNRTDFPRPVPAVNAEIYPAALASGVSHATARYGLFLDRMEARFVHRLAYFTNVWAVPPGSSRAVVNRLVQGPLAPRVEAAERAFSEKRWRDDLDAWDRRLKPASIRASTWLLEIDPASLSDEGLVGYVEACAAHVAAMQRQHHAVGLATNIPTGELLRVASEATGRPIPELAFLLRGATPVSRGLEPETVRLAEAMRRRKATRLLEGDADRALKKLLAQPGELGQLAAAWINRVGHRPVDGYDAGVPVALELPATLIEGLRAALEEKPRADDQDVAALRAQIAKPQRKAFDEAFAEARLTHRLRDERGLYGDLWANGVLRRALLAVGARLEKKKRVHDAAHALDADLGELAALIGGGGPDADELAARAELRTGFDMNTAPPVLGEAPQPPPPLEWLPAPVQRVEKAMRALLQAAFAERPVSAGAPKNTVRGLAASPGIVEGLARVVLDPSELRRVKRGDVLVAPSTSAAFNAVLPLISAVITDRGGTLSHAAITAREFGVPAVVGSGNATQLIADGARVKVDGAKGEVQVLA